MAHVGACTELSVSIAGYLEALVDTVRSHLSSLDAVALYGSAATRSFVPGVSDLDVAAVCDRSPSLPEKQFLADSIAHENLPVPTRRLEFVLYAASSVRNPQAGIDFEINLNTGPELDTTTSFDSSTEPRHWFVIDISICREHGCSLFGPSPREVFAPVPEKVLLEALRESLRWYEDHESSAANTILAASRAWAYALERRWLPKDKAATWAIERYSDAELIHTAVSARRMASSQTFDAERVHELLRHVATVLEMKTPPR
jgi:hypothetical protein